MESEYAEYNGDGDYDNASPSNNRSASLTWLANFILLITSLDVLDRVDIASLSPGSVPPHTPKSMFCGFIPSARQASLIGHMEHIEIAAKVLAIILSLTSGLSTLPFPLSWSDVSENHSSGSELPVHKPTSWLYSLFL